MKKVSVFFLVLASIFCTGCNKTHCPSFPDNLNYFPYYQGQKLKFSNSQNDICSFTIARKFNSKSEDLEWNCKCSCEGSSMFRTHQNQDSLKIDCNLIIYGTDASSVDLNCYFHYSYHYSDYFTKELWSGQKIPYSDLTKRLSDTISIESKNNLLVKKIMIIKDRGLVSYTTSDGEEWILIE
jgi:hypothetical protein